jgi:hypothetical protein
MLKNKLYEIPAMAGYEVTFQHFLFKTPCVYGALASF